MSFGPSKFQIPIQGFQDWKNWENFSKEKLDETQPLRPLQIALSGRGLVMVAYGGDEVSALVLDIGASSTRCGYAGDDSPKTVFSTSYGFNQQTLAVDHNSAEQGITSEPKIIRHLGEQGPSTWRSGMEVTTPFKDGLVSDFSPISSIISHAIERTLGCDPKEHPVLLTEPTWNTQVNRERMAEIMFEEFNIPAFYVANNGVLNAFAGGKGTALVIDVGQDFASVTPVVDGFVLRKGIARSAVPALVRTNARHLLTNPASHQRGPIALLPHQLIAQKQAVDLFQQPIFTYRQDRAANTTESWKVWAEQREVDEWIASVAAVLEQGYSEQIAQSRPPKQYEFPTGYNAIFGTERFLPGECYFNQTHLAGNIPELPKTVPALLSSSLGACDPDLRATLLSHVILTGGGSLLSGFADRLNGELMRAFGNIKLQAAGNPLERRYGAWLGGSMLASLGTFHQLWISQGEWQEHGKGIVAQRCK